MGVPSFYRWLINKYPKIVVNAVEEKVKGGGDHVVGVIDTSLPNPNGIEFDSLYLDMNGIIHPCFHPDDDDHFQPPKTFEDVFSNIFDYINRLFSIVRPRRLLYLAIDGVAPRAKMNQQRTRRFRTAKDTELTEYEEERLQKEFELEGKPVLPKQESEIPDSNVITPGTTFMYELSKALQSYVETRLKTDGGWKNVKVILSDANVPGEGEHKIMSFIRAQQTFPDYDPNTRHCIYGLDADLIMLVLATHEVHFSILREDVLNAEQPVYQSSLKPDPIQEEMSLPKTKAGIKCRNLKPYQFLHVWILREYLELDMKILDPPENTTINLERIIDDFIFICFFTGNDFLPHMPSIEIHEGAIDLLMHVYKNQFKKFGGHLVDTQFVGYENMQYINLKGVEKFILSVGQNEELIFKKRNELRDRKLRRLLAECSKAREDDDEVQGHITSSETAAPSSGTICSTPNYSEMLDNTKELKEKLKCWSRDRVDLFKDGSFFSDKVKFGTQGWKKRFYKEKFSAETEEEIENTRKAVVEKYTEGLCWVLLYYFSGVPSWNWFYPFYYGPIASDMKGLSCVKVNFQKGLPFKPFDQLMGVLPPRSAHALPKPYWELMISEDSKIRDFYPLDFEVDTDGKCFLWQGICKLPFIDEKRLMLETGELDKKLKDEEMLRNCSKKDLLFFMNSDKLGSHLFSVYQKMHQNRCSRQLVNFNESISLDLSCEIKGSIESPLDEVFGSLSLRDLEDIKEDVVLCVQYENPSGVLHNPRLLEKVQFPTEKTVYENDIMEILLWHEYPGGRPSYRPGVQNFRRPINVVQRGKECKSNTEVHKGAGIGWGAGRGRNNITSTESSANGNNFTAFGQNNRPFPVRGGNIIGHSNSESYSGRGNNPYHRRTQELNDNFWPHSNSLAGGRDTYNVPRQSGINFATSSSSRDRNGHSRAYTLSPCRGRGPNTNASSGKWRVSDVRPSANEE